MIKGLVQGVGFRPFICRLADKYGLFGEVNNRTNGVNIIVQGDIQTIDRFSNDILRCAPVASRIKSIEIRPRAIDAYNDFTIADSKFSDEEITEISPDIAVCDACLADMSSDPGRLDYPFVNCTNCGPRFTIIDGLPYDRPMTAMKVFSMCEKCASEYNDIFDRRFHAQPVACNKCGPQYSLVAPELSFSGTGLILNEIAERIISGRSVAIKGMGGYHLICDAMNDKAVSELRRNKNRDNKPFAVMFRNIAEIKKFCQLNDEEEKELVSWRRPIVILRQKISLARSVNSGLATIGAVLPFMPFHYLLFRKIQTPAIVLTSGNLSEEPLIKDDDEAVNNLMPVAGAVVSYNREIYNRADDSVVRIINGKLSLIRRSRGYVPEPVDLVIDADGILALGAEQKNCFCIGKKNQALMSQYIGDLKNMPVIEFFTEAIERFCHIFRFKPEYLTCDLHPAYFSTVYARKLSGKFNLPLVQVQHHHAHIVSCMAEYGLDEKVIGVSFDGTGYGHDGNIWGSEFLVADTLSFRRITHFEYIPMPGGDKVADEPWRMAYSYLYRYFGDQKYYEEMPAFRSVDRREMELVEEMIKKKINCPLTSGAGRLFDAVAALTGLCSFSTFDSEAPMRLESAIEIETDDFYPFEINEVISFRSTFSAILNDVKKNNISSVSAKFHNTLARIILSVTGMIRNAESVNKVVLSGGVFQNKYLVEKTCKLLNADGFEVFTNHLVPANDGGIALGQLVVASKKFK